MKPLTPLVICPVGFPGAGKLTIAQNLARSINATVIDNHWINDPILRLVARDNLTPAPDAVWPLVAEVRRAVLEAIATLAPNDRSFIFTYAGSDEDPADRKPLTSTGKSRIAAALTLCLFACCATKTSWRGVSRLLAGTGESSWTSRKLSTTFAHTPF
jgi:hypothetical protein